MGTTFLHSIQYSIFTHNNSNAMNYGFFIEISIQWNVSIGCVGAPVTSKKTRERSGESSPLNNNKPLKWFAVNFLITKAELLSVQKISTQLHNKTVCPTNYRNLCPHGGASSPSSPPPPVTSNVKLRSEIWWTHRKQTDSPQTLLVYELGRPASREAI